MAEIKDYLDLIPAEHRDKPNFTAMVSYNVQPSVVIQNILLSLIPKYDIDLAEGTQLDDIGYWVGVSRNIAVPVSGVFFSWDGDPSVGWEYGVWQPNGAPTEVTSLPDDVYKTVLKARIAANHWDGTIEGAYKIWDELFTNITILIQDNHNMTMYMAFVGGIVDSLTLALITGGYIPLKPEGVRIAAYFVAVDDGPVFSWDLDSPTLQGWDQGSWMLEVSPT